MAAHAPAVVLGDDEQTARFRRLEFFPTEPWAARAGGELIKRLDPLAAWAWEPAVGQGHMAYGLADYFERVFGTDIHNHGSPWQLGEPLDFLSPAADRFDQADWIITNPPFKPAAEFVRLGLKRARRGVAIFARSGWLETIGRYDLFYGAQPLTIEAPFFERVCLKLGGWDPDGSTATPYSWFLFMKPEAEPPAVRDLRRTLGAASVALPIPPGTKARLTKPEDARLFGRAKPAPLFAGVGL